IAQVVLVQTGYAMEQIDLGHRVVRIASLHFEHADETLPLAARLVNRFEDGGSAERIAATRFEPLQRLERRSVRGLAGENLAIELDGSWDVVQVLLVELGDAILVRDRFVGVLAELCLVRENAEELLPVFRGLVEDVEAAERGEVVRIELEHARVG